MSVQCSYIAVSSERRKTETEGGVGRFDFEKKVLISASGVLIIEFCMQQGRDLYNKNDNFW